LRMNKYFGRNHVPASLLLHGIHSFFEWGEIMSLKQLAMPLVAALQVQGKLSPWMRRFVDILSHMKVNAEGRYSVEEFIDQAEKFTQDLNGETFVERVNAEKLWKEVSSKRYSSWTWQEVLHVPPELSLLDQWQDSNWQPPSIQALQEFYSRFTADGYQKKRYALGVSVTEPTLVNKLISRIRSHGQGQRLLTIGPGLGTIEKQLGDLNVVGVDVTPLLAKQAALNGVRMIVGDAHKLPLASRRFDTVFISEAINHMDPRSVFQEVRRVLRVGGRVIVTYMNSSRYQERFFTHLITTGILREAFEENGFQIVFSEAWREEHASRFLHVVEATVKPLWTPWVAWRALGKLLKQLKPERRVAQLLLRAA